MFDALVQSIMTYGAELWGWQEFEVLERIQTQYFKWCLNLKKEVPNYLILEEVKRRKIRINTGKRCLNYEKNIRKNGNKVLALECVKQIDKRNERNEETKWDKARREYFERNGYSAPLIKTMFTNETNITKILTSRDDEVQKQTLYNKIAKSVSNENYKKLLTPGLAHYLKQTK